jgi:hypothetical protein
LLTLNTSGRANRALLATLTFAFAITTFHVALCFRKLIMGFIIEPEHGNSTIAYFANEANPMEITKIGLYGVAVSDSDYLNS